MHDPQMAAQRQFVWEPIGYSAVLATAYFAMLLCWDLLRNEATIFQPVFTTVWGLGILTTAIVLHALIQTTYRQLSTAFSALLGTLFCVALVILGFSYMYGANGVCDFNSNSADCLYYSVTVITALSEGTSVESGGSLSSSVALYAVWQALLGIFIFLVVVTQMISFTQEYKRIKRATRPVH